MFVTKFNEEVLEFGDFNFVEFSKIAKTGPNYIPTKIPSYTILFLYLNSINIVFFLAFEEEDVEDIVSKAPCLTSAVAPCLTSAVKHVLIKTFTIEKFTNSSVMGHKNATAGEKGLGAAKRSFLNYIGKNVFTF